MKKALSILLILALVCIPLAACSEDIETVELTLWGGEFDQDMLRIMADAFIEANADQANITINLGVESESSAKDTILVDPQAAADVFATVDDQLMELYNAGALQEVSENVAAIKSANFDIAIDAATINGKLMAYPMTTDNGYILFYNKEFLSETDVQSFDGMMDAASALGKKVSMDLGGSWWNVAFFRGAGFDFWLADDGVSTETNLLSKPGATDVVQAMLDIAVNPGFIALGGDEAFAGIQDGSVIAAIDGPWRTDAMMNALGSNLGVVKLPTFTLNGSQVQMGGVLGSKLVGVNRFSEEAGWAMRLADWITNYENQVLRFDMRAQGPSNIQAAGSAAVQADLVLAAIADQARFSATFIPGGNYWGPSGTLAAIIADGNQDGTPLQELIENAVEGMTS